MFVCFPHIDPISRYLASGIISVIEEESPPPPPKVDNKDPFNISNDEYYEAKVAESQIKITTGK